MKGRGQRFAPSPKQVRESYARAVNPDEAPRPVTRLTQMSPEKIAELEKLYGAKVIPRRVALERPPPEQVTIGEKEWTDLHPKCPNKDCDHFMTLRESKFAKFGPGVFYGCKGYPTCKTTWSVSPDGKIKGEPRVR